jgi:hypothetical protein
MTKDERLCSLMIASTYTKAVEVKQTARFRFTAAVLGIAMASIIPFPAQAQQSSYAQRTALNQTLKEYETAITGGDWSSAVNLLPPKVKAQLSKQTGISLEDLDRILAPQMGQFLEGLTFESIRLDRIDSKIRWLPNGAGLAYVPSKIVLKDGNTGNRVLLTSQMLAIFDSGRWYLVRNGSSLPAVMAQAYPGFPSIKVVEAEIEVIEP